MRPLALRDLRSRCTRDRSGTRWSSASRGRRRGRYCEGLDDRISAHADGGSIRGGRSMGPRRRARRTAPPRRRRCRMQRRTGSTCESNARPVPRVRRQGDVGDARLLPGKNRAEQGRFGEGDVKRRSKGSSVGRSSSIAARVSAHGDLGRTLTHGTSQCRWATGRGKGVQHGANLAIRPSSDPSMAMPRAGCGALPRDHGLAE